MYIFKQPGAKNNPDTGTVEYFIKLKNANDYILNTETYCGCIPEDAHNALKVALEKIKIALPYTKYITFKDIEVYKRPGMFQGLSYKII